MAGRRILVIDDEPSIREILTIFLEEIGYTVETADRVSTAITALSEKSYDLVMCDLKLPDGNGLEVLERARYYPDAPPFIIITAHTTPQTALEALRAGAADYLSKPFNMDDLRLILRKLLSSQPDRIPIENYELIGTSPAMRRIMELIPRIAATPSTVLVSGESGTGKELVARAIHQCSPAAGGPFLSVNCGALPEGLLESELFGHAKGSFTGAVRDHVGLFAQAENGIIFLDEVGELTLPMQVRLLRVLQDRRVRPVGGRGSWPSTRGFSRRQTATFATRPARANSERTSSTVSTSSGSRYLRCANASKICRNWPVSSSTDAAAGSACRQSASPQTPSGSSVLTPGRATSASSKTSSNARSPSSPASSSPPARCPST